MKTQLFGCVLVFLFLDSFLFPSTASAVSYYVSKSGSDLRTTSQAQSQSTPWLTIQKCLDNVTAGDVCNIGAGTYNESLTMKTTGTASATITIKKTNDSDTVTVNSESTNLTLKTSGNIGYYTIDGFRFITSSGPSSTGMNSTDASVNFAYNYWGDGHEYEKGNDGFILRNSYIEGAVYFYGSDNLVENCELNGKSRWWHGIIERSQPSENNVFRNNKIYDYEGRGGWSLQWTENTLWEGNTVYNTGEMGIDCDGAGHPVSRCNVKNNHIFSVSGEGAGILLENCFDCIIEGNTINNVVSGISLINYNKDNGDGFVSDGDYKSVPANTVLRNNVIYDASNSGILCKAVISNKALNNTIYNTRQSPGYFGAVAMSAYNGFYCHNWEIKNNIVVQSTRYAIWAESGSSGLTDFVSDYNFYDFSSTDKKIYTKVGSTISIIDITSWRLKGYDQHSIVNGNPMFIDASAGDFHLQTDSPACGMGAFACDAGQETSSPAPVYIVGDINQDGAVNIQDYTLLSNDFSKTGSGLVSDLNSDGIVNIQDFVLLSNNFGRSS